MIRDPVCGMQIQEADAYAVRHIGDVDAALCSAACTAQFDAAPQRYLQQPDHPSPARQVNRAPLLRPLTAGALAMLGLLIFYLAMITLAQGWAHASAQLLDDRNFIAAIVLGFGMQVGLYTYLRGLHAHSAAGGVAASTGTSTAAMLACCAHHLADVLPIVGVAGAAVFLNTYKTPLLWLSIAMNLAGVAYLLWNIQQQRRMACHTPPTYKENIAYGHD
jgi:YHS domain-containing protein